jgi:hypothetical protein
VANGNIVVGNQTTTRKPGQQQMAGAVSQENTRIMGNNECAQQKLVRLVGCRDPKARLESRTRQFNITKKQF